MTQTMPPKFLHDAERKLYRDTIDNPEKYRWRQIETTMNAEMIERHKAARRCQMWFANVDGLDLEKPRPPWKRPGLGLRSE